MGRTDSVAGASDSSTTGLVRVQNSLHTHPLNAVYPCIRVNYKQFTARDKYLNGSKLGISLIDHLLYEVLLTQAAACGFASFSPHDPGNPFPSDIDFSFPSYRCLNVTSRVAFCSPSLSLHRTKKKGFLNR